MTSTAAVSDAAIWEHYVTDSSCRSASDGVAKRCLYIHRRSNRSVLHTGRSRYTIVPSSQDAQKLSVDDRRDSWRAILTREKGYWTTRGYANSRIANSRTGHLADWSTRGLDKSHTGQVADWTTRGCHRRLSVLSFRSFGGIGETASCPVRDLSSTRIV